MSQELTVTTKLAVSRGSSSGQQQVQIRPDQATAGFINQRQSIPTTAGGTVITFTGLTAARYVSITNVDPTNYIDIGPDNSGSILAMVRLLPGDVAVFPLTPITTIRGLAHTGAVVIDKGAAET